MIETMSTTTASPLRSLMDAQFEAILEVMFLAAIADSDVSSDEQRAFTTLLESLTDRRLSGTQLDALIVRFQQNLHDQGRGARFAAARERLTTTATRRTALALVIQIARADGVLRASERTLIFEMAEALELDRDVAEALLASLGA